MPADVQSPRVRALIAWLAERQREKWERESVGVPEGKAA